MRIILGEAIEFGPHGTGLRDRRSAWVAQHTAGDPERRVVMARAGSAAEEISRLIDKALHL